MRGLTMLVVLCTVMIASGCGDEPIVATQPDITLAGGGNSPNPKDPSIPVPVSLRAELTLSPAVIDHNNGYGPLIRVGGNLTLDGMAARVTCYDNGGDPGTGVCSDLTVLEAGYTFPLKPPTALISVEGYAYVFLEILDRKGDHLVPPALLGRCDQGLECAPLTMGIAGQVYVEVSTENCGNSSPLNTRIQGDLMTDGVFGRIVLSDRPVLDHGSPDHLQMDFQILPAGKVTAFANQHIMAGTRANPQVFCQLMDGRGKPISDEMYMGRCGHLSR